MIFYQKLITIRPSGSPKNSISITIVYNDFIKSKGIEEEMCKLLEIGVPKGKTMLAGSVAFAVRDAKGMKSPITN